MKQKIVYALHDGGEFTFIMEETRSKPGAKVTKRVKGFHFGEKTPKTLKSGFGLKARYLGEWATKVGKEKGINTLKKYVWGAETAGYTFIMEDVIRNGVNVSTEVVGFYHGNASRYKNKKYRGTLKITE